MLKDKESTKARCTYCHKSIELSSSGRSALTDHAKGKKHLELVDKRNNFFKPKTKSSTENPTQSMEETISPNDKPGTSKNTLEVYFTNSESIKAEIIWTLKSVLGGFSIRSSDDLCETFSSMFPDSKIARNFSMARTKIMYAINHGIAPYFKSNLLTSLNA